MCRVEQKAVFLRIFPIYSTFLVKFTTLQTGSPKKKRSIIRKIFYLQTNMDPLHTLKKFGIHDSHNFEGDIEPANEKCHFPEDAKLKTTCKLVSIFSCCIESYDAAFQKKLICVVPCFLFPKLVVF